MRYRKLSPDGDYTFGSSEKDFLIDVPEAVGQSVMTRLLLWFGEWFLDTNEGTPYMQGVIGKKTKMQADLTLQSRVLDGFGVANIENYESTINPDTRKLSLSFDVSTIYGPTNVDIENYGNY